MRPRLEPIGSVYQDLRPVPPMLLACFEMRVLGCNKYGNVGILKHNIWVIHASLTRSK